MPYVVIGCSPSQPYDFLLPLTARLWRDRIGFEPILVLTGSPAAWAVRPVLPELTDFRCVMTGDLPGFRGGTVAQSSRQHIAALPWLQPDDFVLTSDADLWPISSAYYAQRDPAKAATFWYANAYNYEHHCTCHIGMSVARWRAFMGLTPGNLRDQLLRTLQRDLAPQQTGLDASASGWKAWNFDEHNTSALLRRQSWYPAECQMIERQGQPPKDRIDRTAWPETPAIDGMVDAHLRSSCFIDEHWRSVSPLWRQLHPDHAWAEDYRARYVQHREEHCA